MEAVQRQRYHAAHESISRLCAQGLPGSDLFAQLSRQLRKAVAFRTAGWLPVDPMTLLPMPGLVLQARHDHTRRLIHNEYFEPDVVKFRDLAHRRVPVQTLWQATGGQLHRSTRYRAVLAGLGYGDDGDVISMTDAARDWLAQLPPDRARGLDLPAAIVSVASEARALAAARPGAGIPAGHIRTSAGRWLRLHAARLEPAGPHGTGQTAVILESAQPADLSPLLFDLHELTGRERQITHLLLRGLPTTDIAAALFISRHTLGDHIKAIFAKLGVTSRPELTALLLDQALGAGR